MSNVRLTVCLLVVLGVLACSPCPCSRPAPKASPTSALAPLRPDDETCDGGWIPCGDLSP